MFARSPRRAVRVSLKACRCRRAPTESGGSPYSHRIYGDTVPHRLNNGFALSCVTGVTPRRVSELSRSLTDAFPVAAPPAARLRRLLSHGGVMPCADSGVTPLRARSAVPAPYLR